MCLLYCSALCWPVRHTALIPTNVEVRGSAVIHREKTKKIVNKDTVTSCIYLTDYWVMWEVLLCTVSTVTLSEIRLLKKNNKKESLLFDITPYNNSIYKRFHLLHKSSRTKQQITNYTQQTNKYLYISRVVCFVSKEKLV